MSGDINTDRQLVQSVWPEWELMEEIARGQFGVVYKACKRGFAGDSFSAVKVISIEREDDESGFSIAQTDSYLASIAQNYAREIKMMEYVKGYSNIVNIEDYSVCQNSGGNPWHVLIRMELLKTLHDDLDGKEITDALVIRIGRDLCHALEICAERKIVHRDIKPSNVLVNDSGVYKLGDFGVARQITRYTSNTTTGTPDYMAPEVFKRSLKMADFDQAHSADIYSLGMLLYWIANDRLLPFLEHGKKLQTIHDKEKAFQQKIDGEQLPPPSKVSPPLQKVLLRACAYDPADRYKTAREFREALESVDVQAAPIGRKRVRVAVITVVLALLVFFILETAGIIDIIKGYPKPTPIPTQALTEPDTPTPEPTTPELTTPEPTTPEPTMPELTTPEPMTPEPMTEPMMSEPTTEPTTSEPMPAPLTVGEYTNFGRYEQDNDLSNESEPIEWLVLDVQENNVLLISRYGLEVKRYNNKYDAVTWETCTLRSWLNDEFLNTAFTPEEQSVILTTDVDNSSDQRYYNWNTSGGNNTRDKVFLLSYAEANRYLNVTYDDNYNQTARLAPTEYAIEAGAATKDDKRTADNKAAGWWWLRSPGKYPSSASFVREGGSVRYANVEKNTGCVRPVIWVNLEARNY